ncbi:Polyamine aminopropyltransferase [subsurface metagenome]
MLKPEAIVWRLREEWRAKLLVCLIVLTIGAGLHSLVTGSIDALHDISARWQWMGHNLVYYQNSVYGNVSITQRGEQLNFYESGLPMFSVPNPDIAFNEEVIHFPILHHPSPRKVLLIGGGIGGTLEQALKHSVGEVHYAELDPLTIEAAREYSPQSFLRALDDPRVSIEHVDVSILGAYQVSERGDLANWALPTFTTATASIGGAMDMVYGAKQIWVAIEHVSSSGEPRIVQECTYPITAKGVVSKVFTDLAVIEVTSQGLVLREVAPGVTLEEIQKMTEPHLVIADDVKEMGF